MERPGRTDRGLTDRARCDRDRRRAGGHRLTPALAHHPGRHPAQPQGSAALPADRPGRTRRTVDLATGALGLGALVAPGPPVPELVRWPPGDLRERPGDPVQPGERTDPADQGTPGGPRISAGPGSVLRTRRHGGDGRRSLAT